MEAFSQALKPMGPFTGTYPCKIDSKSRVSLPADFRDLLPPEDSRAFYIFPSLTTKAIEACDREYIERIADAIEEQFAVFSQEEEILTRIIASSRRIGLDSTGRFILPEEFLKHGGLQEAVLFVGRGRRFQLWSQAHYDSHLQTLSTESIPEFRLKPKDKS